MRWLAALGTGALTLLSASLPLMAAGPSGGVDDERILARDAAGVPTFLVGTLGFLDTAKDPGAEAVSFLQAFAATELGATGEEELSVLRADRDGVGYVHSRIQQRLNGLPVVGTQVIVHADELTGEVYSVNGRWVTSAGLAAQASMGAIDALEVAARDAGIYGTVLDEPELVYVLGSDDQAHLAWRNRVEYKSEDGLEIDDLFADAATGDLVARHPRIHRAKTWRTYDANNLSSLPGTLRCTNTQSCSDTIEQNVHDSTSSIYDYYSTKFGRASWNGSGAVVTSTAHYLSNYVNAFWNGSQLVYGDGNGSQSGPLGNAFDVVAHEFTHAVTQDESGLIYSNESGALNEAWSDIFAAAAEAWADGGVNSNTWKIGEDTWTPATAGDALRYMNNPTQDGSSRDYYPERYTGTADNGGVHWNSGIANLAFYLAVQGGRHPRNKTTVTVAAVGLSRAEQIFYRAQTLYLTPSSNFLAARNATGQAAQDLYGTIYRDRVYTAWCAVGVGACPGTPPGGGLSAPATFNVQPEFCYGLTSLNWSAVSGASRYEVYASSYSSYLSQYKIYDGSGTFKFLNILGGTRYLRVRACNATTCGPYRNGNRPSRYYPVCY